MEPGLRNAILVGLFAIALFMAPSLFESSTDTSSSGSADVEIILFHGAVQCESCQTVGSWTQEVLSEHYSPQLEAGQITYRDVDANKEPDLTARYGVRYVSLWINGEEFPEAFQLVGDKIAFELALCERIDRELGE